jgi:membrane protein YdbS with pleckstrin-like domain
MAASTGVRTGNMPKLLRATYLADTESMLRETRPTALFYLPGPIILLLILAVLDYAAAAAYYMWAANPLGTLIGKYSRVTSLDKLVLVFFIFLTLIALLWLLVRYLRWISTVYAVTNTRVIVQKGIFGRNFDEIPVNQVRGVDVHQTFGQRILGYGTVTVSSEGGTKVGNEAWRGVPRPFEFQRLIENATQVLNRTRSGP